MDSIFDQIMDEDHNMLIQKIEEVTTELEKVSFISEDYIRRRSIRTNTFE